MVANVVRRVSANTSPIPKITMSCWRSCLVALSRTEQDTFSYQSWLNQKLSPSRFQSWKKEYVPRACTLYSLNGSLSRQRNTIFTILNLSCARRSSATTVTRSRVMSLKNAFWSILKLLNESFYLLVLSIFLLLVTLVLKCNFSLSVIELVDVK
jgi:hypothetical protein